MARGRARPSSVLVRQRAPIRGRAAPRHRYRRTGGSGRARNGERCRDVRRHCADGRQDGVDRDAVRLHRHTRAPRLDRRESRRVCRGGRRCRRRRSEWRCRPRRAVRLLRAAHDGRRPGLRRSAGVLAGAACHCRACPAARSCTGCGAGRRAVAASRRPVGSGSAAVRACCRRAGGGSRRLGRPRAGSARRGICARGPRADDGEGTRLEAHPGAAAVACARCTAACETARASSPTEHRAEAGRSGPAAPPAGPADAGSTGRGCSVRATVRRPAARARLANVVDRRARDGSADGLRMPRARCERAGRQTYHGCW
jgi:hypothetical protein